MADFLELFGPTVGILSFVFRYWWVWAAPVSVTAFLTVFLAYKQNLFKQKIEWTILELRMPREIEKSPKAMEQFFAAIHPLRNSPGDFLDKYKEGEVTRWISLEVVSLQGEIHFLMRVPTLHKKIIIANLYGNYPMIDIDEAPDYMEKFPEHLSGLYAQGQDVWGRELMLTKDDAYPIRTYLQFENMEEAMALDPIAGLLETFARIGPGENLILQILVRPAESGWKKKSEDVVKKLKEEGTKKMVSAIGEYQDRPIRTPGETDLIKAIEQNISKPGFETTIRYVYVADKSVFNKEFARRSVITALNQYVALNMNSFAPNPAISTDVKWTYFPWVFPNRRLEVRKVRMYQALRERKIPDDLPISKLMSAHFFNLNMGHRVFVLNTEELATLFHPPTNIVVTGPLLKRVEAKKMGPPSGLPIFEGEQRPS